MKFKLAWLFVLFMWRFHYSFNIEQLFLIMRWFFSGFPIVGRRHGGRGRPSILRIFSTPLPKVMPPMGHPPHPHLKMKPPPSEKQSPPMKHETPFREVILKKSTINNNLKLVSAIFYQIFVFSSSDRPSKTMKNVFYFILKARFILEIFKFL